MGGGFWRSNGARHFEAILKKRPIKRFPVKRQKHGPLLHPRGELLKHRIFISEVAHKELLDLQSRGVPPPQPDEERISAGSACQARRLRVEEKPFRWIVESCARFPRNRFVSCVREKGKRHSGGLNIFRCGKPVSNGEMF